MKASSVALRVRLSLDGSRCVYVRVVDVVDGCGLAPAPVRAPRREAAHAFGTRLHRLRPTSLVVDRGDFFEGSGSYRLAHGSIERAILLRPYDVLAPGNHGWPRPFEPGIHRLPVRVNVIDAETGNTLLRRVAAPASRSTEAYAFR